MVDIGVRMTDGVLEHKLEAQEERNPEEAWNLARWPSGLDADGQHRLFIAVGRMWRGYFALAKEALYNPEDKRTPYTLLFDTRTWTPIPPTPAPIFRGFTYNVPAIDSPHHPPQLPTQHPPQDSAGNGGPPPSLNRRAHRQ
jgi:hypothetical protein